MLLPIENTEYGRLIITLVQMWINIHGCCSSINPSTIIIQKANMGFYMSIISNSLP
jgi:hypothetical protein